MKSGLNNIKGFWVAFCLLILCQGAMAQKPHLGQTSRLMNAAKAAMEQENYEQANQHFREIIDSRVPIPQEMPFLFAETLFHLGQYDNSNNFLQKYLEINGFKGGYYEEAKALEAKLKAPLAAIADCQQCDRQGYRYHVCKTCMGEKESEQACRYCKGNGIIGCSRCAGKGMVTKKNVFNITEYFECERCSGNGRLTCPTCEGSKVEFSQCKVCKGSGHVPSDELCDHKAHDHSKAISKAYFSPIRRFNPAEGNEGPQ